MRPTIEIPSKLLVEMAEMLEGHFRDRWTANPFEDRLKPYLEQASKPLFHIEGRRWFSRTHGNTYHSVRIFKDGERLITLPMSYGYGDQFLDTAVTWLKIVGYVPQDAKGNSLYIRETLHSTYDVTDVDRKKDLHTKAALDV